MYDDDDDDDDDEKCDIFVHKFPRPVSSAGNP